MVEKDPSQISPQYTEQDDSLLEFKKQIYSYSDVLKITNNFNTIVGKGGFKMRNLKTSFRDPVISTGSMLLMIWKRNKNKQTRKAALEYSGERQHLFRE